MTRMKISESQRKKRWAKKLIEDSLRGALPNNAILNIKMTVLEIRID